MGIRPASWPAHPRQAVASRRTPSRLLCAAIGRRAVANAQPEHAEPSLLHGQSTPSRLFCTAGGRRAGARLTLPRGIRRVTGNCAHGARGPGTASALRPSSADTHRQLRLLRDVGPVTPPGRPGVVADGRTEPRSGQVATALLPQAARRLGVSMWSSARRAAASTTGSGSHRAQPGRPLAPRRPRPTGPDGWPAIMAGGVRCAQVTARHAPAAHKSRLGTHDARTRAGSASPSRAEEPARRALARGDARGPWVVAGGRSGGGGDPAFRRAGGPAGRPCGAVRR
jgi:hypothetical protein